jgi:hypothetical protein
LYLESGSLCFEAGDVFSMEDFFLGGRKKRGVRRDVLSTAGWMKQEFAYLKPVD